ncbi:Gfo/Idh/MocA family protein [Oceanobacillus longus]|uniref:Gfo/Idh/MocA family protein n=1 Tax=Oceanobacillus longus TaxID=930120 RepID=A0ABV8GYX4_9BACI
MEDLKIGMIGLDTSHAVAFTKLLNDSTQVHHVKKGKVVMAFPGGSPGFPLSMSRLEGFTKEIKESYSVQIMDSMEEVAFACDAILLESVDGTQHFEQLKRIIPYKKPIFIDKPFSLSSKDAKEMIQLSQNYQTPIMSSSALRFAEGLRSVMGNSIKGKIIGADCFGPMEILEKQPGFFWYGIHTIEMLFTILGVGSKEVSVKTNNDHDLLTAIWKDGRIGTVRGNRKGNNQFGAAIHFEHGTEFVSIKDNQKPFYASLLEEIVLFFQNGVSPVSINETLEIVRFIETANESRNSGKSIVLR